MPGLLGEGLELTVGHRRSVDPEAIHRYAMDRRFFGIMIVRAHAEGAAGNPDHVAGPATFRRRIVLLDVGP